MAKYATNVSGAILLPSSIQVTESISGSVVPLAMFVQQSCLLELNILFRAAKSHGYDGYIRVRALASLGGHTILQNEAFFGGDLHNLCEISLSKLSYIDRIINICSPKVSLLSVLFIFGAKMVAI